MCWVCCLVVVLMFGLVVTCVCGVVGVARSFCSCALRWIDIGCFSVCCLGIVVYVCCVLLWFDFKLDNCLVDWFDWICVYVCLF